jgi:hypothetical protein
MYTYIHTHTHQALQAEKVTTEREILLADSHQDEKLKDLLEKCRQDAEESGLTEEVADKRDDSSTKIKKEVVRRMCVRISDAMGGSISYDQYINFGFATDIQRCKEALG